MTEVSFRSVWPRPIFPHGWWLENVPMFGQIILG